MTPPNTLRIALADVGEHGVDYVGWTDVPADRLSTLVSVLGYMVDQFDGDPVEVGWTEQDAAEVEELLDLLRRLQANSRPVLADSNDIEP